METAELRFERPMLAYLATSRAFHEQAVQILMQLSGFALLTLAVKAHRSVCAGPLESAQGRLREAADLLRSIQPPAAARHHFSHLLQAQEALERCVSHAGACLSPASGGDDGDALARNLREASDQLRVVSKLLPGFETVDLRQACCASHAPPRPLRFTATAF